MLTWLYNFKNPEGQLARWLEVLQECNFTIEHHKGRLHGNANAMSQKPCTQCGRNSHVITDKNDTEEVTLAIIKDQNDTILAWSNEDIRRLQMDYVLERPMNTLALIFSKEKV